MNEPASDLVAEFSNDGSSLVTSASVQWYVNLTDSIDTSASTADSSSQTTVPNPDGTFSYRSYHTPATDTAGTFYYFAVLSYTYSTGSDAIAGPDNNHGGRSHCYRGFRPDRG